MEERECDLLVVGAGPAGLTAGIYAARNNMKVIVIGERVGGTAADAHKIENYPGFPSIRGMELMKKFEEHAKSQGVEIVMDTALRIERDGNLYKTTGRRAIYMAPAVIIATGTQRRKLGVPGEEEFLGRGVSYCATCDAMFYRDRIVAVVGGGDAALDAVLLLSEIARKVYLVHRREEFRSEQKKLAQARNRENLEFLLNKIVKEIRGGETVESIILEDTKTGETLSIRVDGVFIEIGSVPVTALLEDLGVETNEQGYIVVSQAMETNIPGVFAAGDITTGSDGFRQIVTAAAEGGIAARSAYHYISRNRNH